MANVNMSPQGTRGIGGRGGMGGGSPSQQNGGLSGGAA